MVLTGPLEVRDEVRDPHNDLLQALGHMMHNFSPEKDLFYCVHPPEVDKILQLSIIYLGLMKNKTAFA